MIIFPGGARQKRNFRRGVAGVRFGSQFLENPEGMGGHRKNPFRGGGMDIFWNYTFDWKMISFFWFSLKLRSFLSLFFFRFSIMCRRVFNKTIILLGLARYEMIITNLALRASLVIYHFISSAPS